MTWPLRAAWLPYWTKSWFWLPGVKPWGVRADARDAAVRIETVWKRIV